MKRIDSQSVIREIAEFLASVGLKRSNQAWLIQAPTREQLHLFFNGLRAEIHSTYSDTLDVIHFQPSLCDAPGMMDMQKRIIARGRAAVLLLENVDFMLSGSDLKTYSDGFVQSLSESEWRALIQDLEGVAWICGTTLSNPDAIRDPRRKLWGCFVERNLG